MQIILLLTLIFIKSSLALLPGDCTFNQCEHESVCKNHYAADDGFTSFLCNELEIFMVDMFNFESCVVLGYSCNCPEGYFGERCELTSLETDSQSLKCQDTLCLNDGNCLTHGGDGAICNCTEGYTGQFCEVEKEKIAIYPCEPSPCSNNGTCISVESVYNFSCEEGVSGPNYTEKLNSAEQNINATIQIKLNSTLEVVILSPPAEFLPELDNFLSNMTVLLKVSVVLKKDDKGPMVSSWKNGVTGERLLLETGSLFKTRGLRPSNAEGIILTLEVDLLSCTENCFSNIDEMASFIRESVTSKDPSIANWIIFEARAIHEGPKSRQKDTNTSIWKYILIGAPFLALALFWIFVAGKGSKMIRTTVWIPPKEYEILNESSIKRIKGEDAILSSYGQLVLPTIQPKPRHRALTELHLQALSAHPIRLPINPNFVNLKTEVQGLTPLHYIVINSTKTLTEAIDDIEKLIGAGADVNIQNNLGETALYLACRCQKSQIVAKLLSLGADPSVRNDNGSTPIHQAAHNNDLRTMEELLKYENVRKMINVVDAFDRTPLMVCALEDVLSCEIADRLISAGAEMAHSGNQCNMAVCNTKTALHCAVESSNIPMIKYLVRKGANKDAQDKKGRTALFLAAELSNMHCVKTLLELGSSNEVTDQRDMTPQDVANFVGANDIANYISSFKPVSTSQPIVTKQIAVQKVKKTTKRKWLPPTPPSSDESITSTMIEIDCPSVSKNGEKITQNNSREQHFTQENDYSPQGLGNGLIAQPYYWPSHSGESGTQVSDNYCISSPEETNPSYSNYMNFINL